MADGATPRRATVTTMAGLEGSCKVPGAPVSSKASLSVQKVLGVQQRWDIPPPLLIERPAAAPAVLHRSCPYHSHSHLAIHSSVVKPPVAVGASNTSEADRSSLLSG
jgi:hypothetical protein